MNKKKYPTPATIVIRLNSDETIATLMGDEFCTRFTRALAKRNPKDEYDAYIGARVALDRLFDKDFASLFEKGDEAASKKEAICKPKFRVGDIVRVTDAALPFDEYATGDVAVVTGVKKQAVRTGYGYAIKVRSKERKGREGYAWEEELTLLHRPAKEGEKR